MLPVACCIVLGRPYAWCSRLLDGAFAPFSATACTLVPCTLQPVGGARQHDANNGRPACPPPAGTQDGQQGVIYTVPKGGSGRQTFITCPATGGCNKPIGLNIIAGQLGGANGANGFLFAYRRESSTLIALRSCQLPACICAPNLSASCQIDCS